MNEKRERERERERGREGEGEGEGGGGLAQVCIQAFRNHQQHQKQNNACANVCVLAIWKDVHLNVF